MSLYADYLHERTNDLILESASSFITYRYLDGGTTVYIIDIYTAPFLRKQGNAACLADMVVKEAKEKGATKLLGTVQLSAKGSTDSLKVLLAYGMELDSAGSDHIVMRKAI
jgi:hypothetical protein